MAVNHPQSSLGFQLSNRLDVEGFTICDDIFDI